MTSARMSPTLGRSVCLGQVASRLAEPGTEVRIRLTDGRLVAAHVTEHLAAVDPEGVRLRWLNHSHGARSRSRRPSRSCPAGWSAAGSAGPP